MTDSETRTLPDTDLRRRRLLTLAMSILGGLASLGAAMPFLASLAPSKRTKAAGAPQLVDLEGLKPGELRVAEWRGKPVWVLRRTDEMLEGIRKDDPLAADPNSDVPQQPPYARNEYRSIEPHLGVFIGVCTHLGCSPMLMPASAKAEMGPQWNGGFYCPCHGSRFDYAGRVLKGSPAPTNLVVPPYRMEGASAVRVGDETSKA